MAAARAMAMSPEQVAAPPRNAVTRSSPRRSLASGAIAAPVPPAPPTTTPSEGGKKFPVITSWRRGEELGRGAFGTVYMAQDCETGHLFAAKVSRAATEERHAGKLKRELEICAALEHKHIVRYLGHEYVDQCLHIFLEYVSGGSLRRMLNDFGPLDKALLRKAARGILEGLDFLHCHSPPVIHRDLKGANVLVDGQFCMKLSDFGCSKCDDCSQTFTACGTVHWMAPEIVIGTGGYGRKADIWSLGCLMVEMVTAADPWGKNAFDNLMQAMNIIRKDGNRPPIPDTIEDAARDMMESCLQRTPEQRPTSTELLAHALVSQA